MSTEFYHKIGHTPYANLFQNIIPDWTNQFFHAKKSEGISSIVQVFF